MYLLLLIVSVAQAFGSNTWSQSATLTFRMNNVSIEEVLNTIEEQSEFRFLYNKKMVDVERMVNISVHNENITAILDNLFRNAEIAYAISDRQIVLNKKGAFIIVQQSKRIAGMVTDENGEPLIGANVLEKGTANGVITDVEGKFSLNVSENAVLQVSFIGYLTQEIVVQNQTDILVTLAEDAQALEEVVVIGYGTQRKGEVASAITSVKAENFIKFPSPDASKMIRGQVAGLAVVTPDANPLSTSQIMLRGITTLKASAAPLILIDGIPGDLMTVSPDDIEQIDVLKDGSAAAIYGTRGTNGVIIITTKNAKGEMPTTVDVNAYLSTQQITRKLPFMTYDQYVDKVRQGKPGAMDYGGRTAWLDEVLQTPLTQVYNISLRGGSKTTNYVASFDYRSLEGIVKRSDNRMIFPRIEVTHRMFDNKLKVNAGLSGYQQVYFAGSSGGGFNTDVYKQAIMHNPTDPVKDENGVWTERPVNAYLNPVALLHEVDGEIKATTLRMFADAIFTPVTGLDIKLLVSDNTWNQTGGYYETQKHYSTVMNGRNGYASIGTGRSANDLAEFTVQYSNTLKGHHFTVLGGYSWLKYSYQAFSMSNFNFPSDDYTYNNMGQGQALSEGRAGMGSSQNESKLMGYFGRLNYGYKGKYMLAASLRYEGSSKFGANHKWGTFPAASVAWNIRGEDFMEDISPLSTLKLRAGFGVTGTEPGSPYMSLNTLSFGDYAYANGEWIKSIRPASNFNPDLRWEKKEETNIGLDFGLFEDRLTGSIDFYNRDTKDLLWDYAVPSPPYLFSSITANAGSIRNRGVEIALQAIPVETSDFRWVTNANFSTNKNTLLTLSNDQYLSSGYSDQGTPGEPLAQENTHRIQEGKPIGNFYGYKSIDIDENGRWIIEGADGNPKPIAEQRADDKKILGNGLPKYYLNWNNSVSYRHFDLGITMRGAFGFQILNMAEMFYAVPMQLSRGNLFQKAYEPVYGKRPLADDQELQYVSYFIEDGDYWKIDNLMLGYTFDFNSRWIRQFRLYGTVSNLAVITRYSGIDPEVPVSGLAPGDDNTYRYPAARTFTIGASFKF
jgi:TonB-linked SusC/RagA family outer membrane protein